jgi:hypothetical protein
MQIFHKIPLPNLAWISTQRSSTKIKQLSSTFIFVLKKIENWCTPLLYDIHPDFMETGRQTHFYMKSHHNKVEEKFSHFFHFVFKKRTFFNFRFE